MLQCSISMSLQSAQPARGSVTGPSGPDRRPASASQLPSRVPASDSDVKPEGVFAPAFIQTRAVKGMASQATTSPRCRACGVGFEVATNGCQACRANFTTIRIGAPAMRSESVSSVAGPTAKPQVDRTRRATAPALSAPPRFRRWSELH